MSNLVSFQSDTVVFRNGMALWRPANLLSDDDLFDEYRELRNELRRREKRRNSKSSTTH